MRNTEVYIGHDEDFVHVEIREPVIRKFRRTYKITKYDLLINKWMKLNMDGRVLFMLDAKLAILYGKGVAGYPFGGNSRHWRLIEKKLKVYADGLQSIYSAAQHAEATESAKLMTKALALPGMNQKPPPCPQCHQKHAFLASMVMHLNDKHRWTRERIANWLQDQHDEGVIDISFKVNNG